MRRVDRRRFLGRAAVLGAGAAGFATLTGCREERADRHLRLAYWGSERPADMLTYVDGSGRADRVLAGATATFTEQTGRGVDIKLDDPVNYRDRLAEEIARAEPADVVYLQGHGHLLAAYAAEGHLLPLDDYVPDPLGIDDFPDPAADLALALDPAVAGQLHQPDVYHGIPPSLAVREAVAADVPDYAQAFEYVRSVEQRLGPAPPPPPAAADLVLEDLAHYLEAVGRGEMPLADAVDSFFTDATNLLG